MTEFEELSGWIESIEPELIDIRRTLHQWPEMGLTEEKTCDLIEKKLKEWQIPYERIQPSGIVAFVGDGKNGTIGLRADMDGLPIQEVTEAPYCSRRDGYMHACGHDAHVAGLLGAAYGLKQMEQKLSGKVKFFFQPAEEICKGAKLFVEHGLADDLDSMVGFHIFSDLPYGIVSMEPGPRMARTDRFEIRLRGKGGHAAKPHQCVDATVMAAALTMNLQTIVSRRINPIDTALLTIGSLHSGTQYNIISGEAVLTGTIRSFQSEIAEDMIASMGEMVEKTASMYGGEGELIAYPTSHPPLINDEKTAKDAACGIEKMLGIQVLNHVEKLMLGEDFSNYQEKVPCAFGFVGGGKAEGINYPNHHPSFDIDERGIALMAKCYGSYAVYVFGNQNDGK